MIDYIIGIAMGISINLMIGYVCYLFYKDLKNLA
jgi:hypothetical protein